MHVLELLDQGKAAYKRKDYSYAVQLFSEILALKHSTAMHLDVLDLRCQAYSKLGKQDLALQDARHITHTSKRKLPTGYLRCAQIERLSGNYVAAGKWLEHGSKNVPQHQHLFETQLRKIQSLACKEASDRKRRDPISSVPLEVLQLILSYLRYREVVNLLRVSRTWKGLLTRLKPLATSIDFTGARGKVSNQACSAALRRLGKTPQRLILTSLSQPATKTLQFWINKLPCLETLEVLYVGDTEVSINRMRFEKLNKIRCIRIGQGQQVDLKDMFRIIGHCQSLQEVVMHGVRHHDQSPLQVVVQAQLHHLELHADWHSPFILEIIQLKNYPNLQSLSIAGGIFDTHLLDLSDHHRLSALHLHLPRQSRLELVLPASIEELTGLDTCKNHPTVDFAIAEPVNVPKLHTMAFRHDWAVAVVNTLERSTTPSKLSHVSISHVPQTLLNEKSNQNCKIFDTCDTLTFVSHELRDCDLDAFAALFPVVGSLTLEAPMITGVFISDLVRKKEGSLKEVFLRDCGKVSLDILPWLRARNILCQFINPVSETKGTRRVRDAW